MDNVSGAEKYWKGNTKHNLKNNYDWRAVAARSVPDKNDKSKNCWFMAAEGPPRETCWIIEDGNKQSHRVLINPKEKIEERKSGSEKEGLVAEKRKIFEEKKPEPKEETFWEKRKKASEAKKGKKSRCNLKSR